YVTAVIQRHELGPERGCDRFRACQRDGILPAMDDYRRAVDGPEIAGQVEVAEALPDRLLNAPRHAKRREIGCPGGVRKIPGDAQLECALAIGAGIAFLEPGRREFGAHRLNCRPILPASELGLEHVTV